MMVTSKEKSNPFCVKIDDWKDAGLKVESWARIDRIISMDEWRMNRKIGNLSEKDLRKFMELIVEFMTDTIHDFSLVAVSNPEGKFLQVYDERYKIYNHKLYKLLLTDIPESMRDDIFEIDGTKYSWRGFEELEVDLNTMQKNDDVIAFVKSKL